MSPSFRAALAWIVGSLLIVLFALMPLSAAWLNGEYLPSNADAFYHARRALDVAMTGQAVTQFDDVLFPIEIGAEASVAPSYSTRVPPKCCAGPTSNSIRNFP